MANSLKKKKTLFSVGNILKTKDEMFSNIIVKAIQTKFPSRSMIKLEKDEQIIITEKKIFRENNLSFYRLKLFSMHHGVFISVCGEKKEILDKFILYARV